MHECILVQVLRVLVQLYFNLATPDFISVCQVSVKKLPARGGVKGMVPNG